MKYSSAYTGPTDWQTVDYEWYNPLTDEYEMLEVDFEVRENILNITEVRHRLTQHVMSLSREQRLEIHDWLFNTYEPTEDL